MTEHMLLGVASVIVLGIAAQWLAWRLHLPAILLLLLCGFVAGPITGILEPDRLFGEFLFPLVSLSVALILFEGGLSLKLSELRQVGKVVISLITIGIMITWMLAAAAAWAIGGLEAGPAILLGAILVVSGPTVIIPLLRQIRPVERIGSIIKWEGIVNDPIGAILAVLVFEVILAGGLASGSSLLVPSILKAMLLGSLIGLAGAVVIVVLLRYYLIPDYLQNSVALMMVVMTFLLANMIQTESGLLAVTIMGIGLANQKFVSIKHITEFKENLRVLLIAALFIILAARIPIAELQLTSWSNWVFVLVLIILVRPTAVWLSTLTSKLKLNERAFLAWMAPRGVVAAAVVSVFALRLAEAGFSGYERLVPLTFLVIVGTVTVYGLTANPLARRLKLTRPNPQGVLFAGASDWVRQLALALQDRDFRVVVVDSNWGNVARARQQGIRAYYGSILSEELTNELQLDGIGRLLAVTPNDEVNSLATLHFIEIFGRSNLFQLAPPSDGRNEKKNALPLHLRGRFLFEKTATFDAMTRRFQEGSVVKKTRITEEFSYDDLKARYGPGTLPLVIITESGNLQIVSAEHRPTPRAGDTLLSIIDAAAEGDNTDRRKAARSEEAQQRSEETEKDG
jgi:NhaP-type Na+/H+ or K+/H+ antiporter